MTTPPNRRSRRSIRTACGSSTAGVTPSKATYTAFDMTTTGAAPMTARNGTRSRRRRSPVPSPTVAVPTLGSCEAAPSPGKWPTAAITPPLR